MQWIYDIYVERKLGQLIGSRSVVSKLVRFRKCRNSRIKDSGGSQKESSGKREGDVTKPRWVKDIRRR